LACSGLPVVMAAQALATDQSATPNDPRLTARIVINTIEGLTHRLVLRPSPVVTPDEIANEITELVRAYIQTRHPPVPMPVIASR
jgi:hypothetical protein